MIQNSPLRLLASLLVPLYAAGVWVKNAAYDFHLLRPKRLSLPVLCIGNLSVGGTGKTPMVMLLAHLLKAHGWQVDVLTRGYDRASDRVEPVDPEMAPDRAVENFGDEPVLMARQGIRVFVGADRYRAGRLAETFAVARSGSWTAPDHARGVHLLDDGFQHRRLARAVDIVLLQRRDLKDRLLPLGRLREPIGVLRRASICVLRAEDADLKDRVLRLMNQSDAARVWIIKRRIVFPASAPSPSQESSAVAFCAIGDPRSFFQGLRDAGLRINKEVTFRDHHVYTERDIERIGTAARSSGASCFVTTEKDAVRLAGPLRAQLERQLPLRIAGLEVRLCEEDRSLATLESLVQAFHADIQSAQVSAAPK